jgi:hypothetical protein
VPDGHLHFMRDQQACDPHETGDRTIRRPARTLRQRAGILQALSCALLRWCIRRF